MRKLETLDDIIEENNRLIVAAGGPHIKEETTEEHQAVVDAIAEHKREHRKEIDSILTEMGLNNK